MTTAPIPTAELERIIELGKRATDSDWRQGERFPTRVISGHGNEAGIICGTCLPVDESDPNEMELNNAAFIAAARIAPALAAELIAARKQLAACADILNQITNPSRFGVSAQHVLAQAIEAETRSRRLLPSAAQETE